MKRGCGKKFKVGLAETGNRVRDLETFRGKIDLTYEIKCGDKDGFVRDTIFRCVKCMRKDPRNIRERLKNAALRKNGQKVRIHEKVEKTEFKPCLNAQN